MIQQIPSLQLLVMSAAFRAVQGILELFVVKSSTTITMLSKIEVVAPGVTIFVYVNSNSFQQQSFFNNSMISRISIWLTAIPQASSSGIILSSKISSCLNPKKEALRSVTYKVLGKWNDVDTIGKLDARSQMLDALYKRLEGVTERINNLTKQDHDNIRSIAQQVRSRKLLMLAG